MQLKETLKQLIRANDIDGLHILHSEANSENDKELILDAIIKVVEKTKGEVYSITQ